MIEVCTDANFVNAFFLNAGLYCTNCHHYDLVGANFRGAGIPKGGVEMCHAQNIDFSQAHLLRISFDDSDLRGSLFQGADLSLTSFMKADLRGCQFLGATLDSTYFSRTRCDWSMFDDMDGTIYADQICWGGNEEPMPREACAAYLARRSKVTVLVPTAF